MTDTIATSALPSTTPSASPPITITDPKTRTSASRPSPETTLPSFGRTAEPYADRPATVLRPVLRGWMHAAMLPVTLVAGVVLVVAAAPGSARAAAVVFGLSTVVLFGTSAVYHRGTWSPRVYRMLRRADHANIFVTIAATYTPFVVLLPRDRARWTLAVIWLAALAGVAFRVLWVTAPRKLHVPAYAVAGLAGLACLRPPTLDAHGPVWLLLVLGLGVNGVGALVYALQRPDPLPRWFGFHEIFHACTVVAFGLVFTAELLAIGA